MSRRSLKNGNGTGTMLDEHLPFRDFVYSGMSELDLLRTFRTSGKPVFDANGNFLGYRGTATDITATIRADHAEQALRKAQAELAHVTRVTTLGELTTSIAHEVNQPLAAVMANAEASLRWLDREPPNLVAARRSVEWVINDSCRASEVIRRVRALANKTEIEKGPIDINNVVRDVVALVQRELSSHRVSLRTELAPGLPMVLGDRIQLQQVIINLVMNGIEAMQTVTDRATRTGDPVGPGRGARCADQRHGLRRRDLCREREPAVQCLLHHEVERSRYGAFNLSVDRGGSRGTADRIR